MSTDRILRLTLGGDILQNATATATLRVKMDATEVWRNNNVSVGANDVDRRPWNMEFWLQNISSAAVQVLEGNFFLGSADAAAAGQGTAYSSVLPFQGSATKDTSSAFSLIFSVQWDTNSANASFRKRLGVLELL